MSLSPYTLVRSRRKESTLVSASVSEAMKQMASNTVFSLVENREALDAVALRTKNSITTVGIWDLGAWVGGLADIIHVMNGAQSKLLFFQAQAAIPSGITSSKQRIVKWSEATLKRKLSPYQKRELNDAIIAVDFFPLGESVRKDVGVNYLFGITPDAIAAEVNDEEGHVVHSDFFNSSDARTSLVSTVDLREFAAAANRKFEYAIGFLIAAIMFSELNGKSKPTGGLRIGFHENSGCLMDYNFVRSTIVPCLAEPHVCNDVCVPKSKPQVLETIQALLNALNKYPRPDDVKR